ncbi:serine hydrolase domain-containing protein [Streptomyces sp. NPDC088116]|uniref:serine hydrolase domain-containing protein n=1 Tax=Streptomyces sp. NPDC088116 TaxID=3365825 RepID=UPI003801D43F
MRTARLVGAAVGATLLMTSVVPAATAAAPGAPGAEAAPSRTEPLDRAALRAGLDAIDEAGMYGVYSSVRAGSQRWTGAAGEADVDTGRPMKPGMRHRVGSVSKTFTAVALLQQVEQGRIDLDAPVADYLPDLIPGERGRTVTVRMLLNHTSGIGDYILGAFPSLAQNSTTSLEEERFRSIPPEELVRIGLKAPVTEQGKFSYSNTNYVIAGLILEEVTGRDAATYITRNVIDRAGLRHTSYPRTPYIAGPHPRMYESFYGLGGPPRDYGVYNMSWASTAGSIVSTTDDLNRFYRVLLGGKLIGSSALTEMLRTVPAGGVGYGLGIYSLDLSCGRFWGHDGAVFGAATMAMSSRDGKRQLAYGWNLTKYQKINEEGQLEPSPIDAAINGHMVEALCPGAGADARKALPGDPSGSLPGVDIAPDSRPATLAR